MTEGLRPHWLPPEPDFVPEGYLTTHQALDLVGSTRMGDAWQGDLEFTAWSDAEIEAEAEARRCKAERDREKAKKAKRVGQGVTSGASLKPSRRRPSAQRRHAPPPRGPGAIADLRPVAVSGDERRAARARADEVWAELQQWLYADRVRTVLLGATGKLFDIDPMAWGTARARAVFFAGEAPSAEAGPGKHRVLISVADLAEAIRGEASAAPEAAPPSEPREDTPSPRRGPRPKYDWQAFLAQVVRVAHYDGLPDTQAEMERKMLQWCENEWGCQPGLSTVRTYLGPLYRELKNKDYISDS